MLVVTDPKGNKRDWESFVAALRAEKRLVDVKTADDFPRDALLSSALRRDRVRECRGRPVRSGSVQGAARRGPRPGRRVPDGRRP